MKKTSLNELIYNRILRASFVMVVSFILIFILIYYGTTSYMSGEMLGALRQTVVQGTVQAVERETEIIGSKVTEINHIMLMLQNEHEQFFKHFDNYVVPNQAVYFDVHENGSYYKKFDNGGSALYYSGDRVMDQDAIDKALYTEYLDPSFKSVVDENPMITQVYINTYDNMNRIYPFIDNLSLVYGPTINMMDYNFYNLAILEKNPEKEPVWTSAYLDPAGQGYMVSCVVPIYNGKHLEGVTGVDLALGVFIDEVLNIKLPVESAVFVADDQGLILAMNGMAEDLLSLKELREYEYDDTVSETVRKPEEFRMDKLVNNYLGERLEAMLEVSSDTMVIELDHDPYHIIKNQVEGTQWHLFVMTSQDNLLGPVYQMEDRTTFVGSIVFLLILFMFGSYYVYFIKRSRDTTTEICKPIVLLTHATGQLGMKSDLSEIPESTGIKEIDALTKQFKKMVEEIDQRTEDLIEKELETKIQEQMAQVYKKQAHIDDLTQVFNRRRIDDILEQEINRASRYNQDLSVILVDIDHFKLVNDQYGHDVGDEVLVDFAKILQKTSRTTDFISRWGGEEFLIVCPHTDIDGAKVLAEKLRNTVEMFNFTTEEGQTASFGVVQYTHGNNKRLLLKQVDTAMYEAKSQSRNCVVAYDI